jgi:hypothetical protein
MRRRGAPLASSVAVTRTPTLRACAPETSAACQKGTSWRLTGDPSQPVPLRHPQRVREAQARNFSPRTGRNRYRRLAAGTPPPHRCALDPLLRLAVVGGASRAGYSRDWLVARSSAAGAASATGRRRRSWLQWTAVIVAAGTQMSRAAPPKVSASSQKATAARWKTWAW